MQLIFLLLLLEDFVNCQYSPPKTHLTRLTASLILPISKNECALSRLSGCCKRRYRSNPDEKKVRKDIAYLQELRYLCDWFSVPTTCGYDILHKEETSSDNVHAHFAMTVLGVTIKVRPHCYHYFFGTLRYQSKAIILYLHLVTVTIM